VGMKVQLTYFLMFIAFPTLQTFGVVLNSDFNRIPTATISCCWASMPNLHLFAYCQNGQKKYTTPSEQNVKEHAV